MLPGGSPGHSNVSDAAAISVIISLNDKEPRTIIAILDVL